MKNTIRIYLTNILIIFLFSGFALSQPFNIKSSKDNNVKVLAIVDLTFIDPGVTAYGGYRWQDIAGNEYSASYRTSYGYNLPTVVEVQISFDESAATFNGSLTATNLKPNFTYQTKLAGFAGTESNEFIGLTGRWWQEEWNGVEWANGMNLNNKGDGSSPNPNDVLYFARKDSIDLTSPTGKNYKFTGYLPFGFFTTDENGNAAIQFEANSAFHVFWNTIQRTPGSNDGPTHTHIFDPDPLQPAYDFDYPSSSITVFGEWERLPMGGVYLPVGDYDCQFILTEESFHGWPLGSSYPGNWASVMGADIQFTIEDDDPLFVQLSSFSAESGNSGVLVRWVTESEINQAGFEILKSSHQVDGYSSISDYRNNPDLMGHGNSSIKHEYLYIDRDVLVGQSYWYYLVDVELNGQRTYHGPVHVYLMNNKGLKYLSSNIPEELMLYPNFPNPFNSMTVIRFDIPQLHVDLAKVNITLFNSLGQKVITLFDEKLASGIYEFVWNGKDKKGVQVPSGVYIYSLKTENYIKSKKMLLVK